MDIDRLRDGYRPAARRGAILFFVLSEMALVNFMYQYSLIAFLEVFRLSLKKSLPDSILMKRLRNIMDTLTFNIYNYGCTGEHLSALLRTEAMYVHPWCLCVQISSSSKEICQIGLQPNPMASSNLISSIKRFSHLPEQSPSQAPVIRASPRGFWGMQFSQEGRKKVEGCCSFRAH